MVPKGRLIIAVESGGWTVQPATFIIVDDQKANIIGRNILPIIGIKLLLNKPKRTHVLSIHEKEEASDEEIKNRVKEKLQQQGVEKTT